MAHFRATIQGSRGSASRLGTKKTGLEVRANSWDSGARVVVTHENQGGLDVDVFRVYRTLGSSPAACSSNEGLIAKWAEKDGYTLFAFGCELVTAGE